MLKHYARCLTKEAERFLSLPLDECKADLCDTDADTLLSLWFASPISHFRTRLFDAASPLSVSLAMQMMARGTRAESLIYMDYRQRRRVVGFWTRNEQNRVLEQLETWQQLEENNWPDGIYDVLIMTGELPSHYPDDMKMCIDCEKVYSVWDSVVAADCRAHSMCDDCADRAEGHCSYCR
jgi:hypothetical protein